MKRFLFFLAIVAVMACNTAFAAILVQSENGSYSPVYTTLSAAATAPNVKKVIVTTALSAVMSNISSATMHAWPSDRSLEFYKGGSIANSTTFRYDGDASTWPKDTQIFKGTGRILFSNPIKVFLEWWGAKGDSTGVSGSGTDCTDSIRYALVSLPYGGVIQGQMKKYRFTSVIKFPELSNSITLQGQNIIGTIFFADVSPSSNTAIWDMSNSNVVLRDLSLYGINNSNTTGIFYNLSHYVELSNVEVRYFNDGIKTQSVYELRGYNVKSNYNLRDGFTIGRNLDGTVAASPATNHALYGGEIGINGRYGLYVSGRDHSFNSVSTEWNTTANIYGDYLLGATFNTCYSEGTNTSGQTVANQFYLTNSSGIVISGLSIPVWTTGSKLFYIKDSSAVTINGLLIDSSTLNDAYAIYLDIANEININGVNITNIGHGVYVNNYSRLAVNNFVATGVTVPINTGNNPNTSLNWDGAITGNLTSSTLGALIKYVVRTNDGQLFYQGYVPRLVSIPSYANNSAAITGGLATGDLYRNTTTSAVTVVTP